ncbi:MAG: glycosyltransferase [Acetivibrionales bacterium]|jgi:GT2 family glycosyltransferase
MSVGIAMVNYNGSDVLALTLDSLARAKTETPFIVCLVDNASEAQDYARVQQVFEEFAARPEASGKDTLIRNKANLGISGGNNLGCRTLLENPEVERICFLNTDVIVTDGWLDRLMESGLDMVGPVTNANGNEQTICVDYDVSQNTEAYEAVAEFAEFRADVYSGYEVKSEGITTFCALIKREAIEEVGEFDTRFYPGGFDDNDFCMRMRAAQRSIGIRRDCYIHHWGSGSFSKLNMDSRIGISFGNMRRFEHKWNTTWTGNQHLLLESLHQDAEFLLHSGTLCERTQGLLRKTNEAIKGLINRYEGRQIEVDKQTYAKLIEEQLQVSAPERTTSERQKSYGTEPKNDATEQEIHTVKVFDDPQVGGAILQFIREISRSLYSFVLSIYHAALNVNYILRAPIRRRKAYRVALDFIRNARRNCKGAVCVLAPMYRESNLADGYIQRVYAVDNYVLGDYAKLYFESDGNYPPFIEVIDDRHMVLHGTWNSANDVNALKLLFSRSGIVYSHSLLRCDENELNPRLLRWLSRGHVKFIVDMHGSVPEEAAFYDNWTGAQVHGRVEEDIMAGADIFICVNHTMKEHFEEKYSYTTIKPEPIVMPIYLDDSVDQGIIESKLERSDYTCPLVVYAGGVQKWQNIPLMQEAIERVGDRCRYDIMVSEPEEYLRLNGKRRLPSGIKIHRVTPEEVFECYRDAYFGFILRDEHILNKVACPTKLIEYIRFGIIPILKSNQIGDFARYNLRYLPCEQFSRGKLPDAQTYLEMAKHNFELFKTFNADYLNGRDKLLALLERRNKS